METFKVEIKETLSRTIEIKATSKDDAYIKVREMYKSEEIVLDADDYVDTEFIEIEE